MKHVLKAMKNKIPLIILIIIFLIIEVYCDLTLPSYTADIVNKGIANSDISVIQAIGINMMIMVIISVLATIIVSFLSSMVSSSYARDLREQLFKNVLTFSNHELNNFSRASLITRSTNDINQLQNVMGILFRTLLFAPILGIGSILRVFEIGSDLSWIIFVAFIIIAMLLSVVIINVIPSFRQIQEIVDNINRVSREILLGIPAIKAFVRQDYEEKRFEVHNREYLKVNLRVYRIMLLLLPLMNLTLNLMIVSILYFGTFEALKQNMLTGDIIAFIQYATQMVAAFMMMGGFTIMLPRILVSARRIDEVLATKSTIVDGSVVKNDDVNILEFRNVSYKYHGAEKDTLHDINFTLKAGKTTALIGGTGSGKSTIVNLIPRLQDVTRGEILLNNVNIKEYNLRNLREKIAYAPQKAVLFSGSIRSNLLKGKNDASDAEIKKALDIAQASVFVDDLDGQVLQNASNFSGGQRQRLSIARALIGEHEFYLFDDCFSALDVKTEKTLRENLKSITSDKSVLIVSQRISSIKHADEIIVLDNGHIVDKGTHKELLDRCSFYREIMSSQKENMEALL